MGLSPTEEAKLASAVQFCQCRFVTFDVKYAASVGSFVDGVYAFDDLVNIHPRHSWVANSASIIVDATDSIQRGGAASTGHVFTDVSGSGTLVDNSDGTATYTAPASGTGTYIGKCVTDGNTNNNYFYIAYGDQGVDVGKVTSFHADIGTGGWELTLQAFGDCSGLERQKGILIVVNDYWNGSEDTFGGYKWSDGAFYGYVDRIRRVHEDFQQAYLEVKVVSPSILANFGYSPDLLFVTSDTADDNIVVADFEVMDAIWWILIETGYNLRHNAYISDDDNTVDNLKLGKGPVFDVIRDVAARSFYVVFDSKLGDTYVVGDPDVRYGNYFTGFSDVFTLANANIEMLDIQWEDICDPEGDPPDPPDPTYAQVHLTAIQSDLTEISSTWPSSPTVDGGNLAELSGLICETQATLDAWAEYYWYKLQPYLQGSVSMFLMHHVDLYDTLLFNITIRELTNTGTSIDYDEIYVTGIDYDIDPGMGTWRGQVQFISRAPQA
jgi:hypothetical protein